MTATVAIFSGLGAWVVVIMGILVFAKGITIKPSPKPEPVRKPDVVSSKAKISDYYYKIGNCYYWKTGYNWRKASSTKCRE